MKAIRAIAIAICMCTFGIAFGQSSSSEKNSMTEISKVNVGFGNNPATIFSSLVHDANYNYFVSGFSVGNGFGAEIVKYSSEGQYLWGTVWDKNDTIAKTTTESGGHQVVYSATDNTVVVASLQEYGSDPELVAKLDASDGHQIWQVEMSAMALETWGQYTLALQENGSTGNIFLINNGDGSIKSTFAVNFPLDAYPMMKVLGDTTYVFTESSFAKFLLPSGQLLWQVSTTDFATRAIGAYGTVDSRGNSYVFTSDAWDSKTGLVLFSAAKYSSDGKKVWGHEWYGWSDSSLVDGYSQYNLNNWASGIAIDESIGALAVFGGTQRDGTAGYETSDQSAYLAILDPNNGDTLETEKWDDGSSVVTLWNDGFFNPQNQLVLLGQGFASNEVLIVNNFISIFDIDLVASGVHPNTRKESTFQLSQNYPNPFNPSTNISFTLGASSSVKLEVYNLLGQKVATVVNGFLFAGSHTYQFDASKLASGVYIYRLEAGSFTKTMKMVLMK